jgi:argininosuccinate lyase
LDTSKNEIKTLWSGRFQKGLSQATNDFNSSLSFDIRMAKEDILGSLAHAAMLQKQNIITSADHEKISAGLLEILDALASGALVIDENSEDIHTFIETLLTEKIGEAGKRLHTGRSRNDQVALDFRLYIKKEAYALQAELLDLCNVLCMLSKSHLKTIMPGYTHLQRAQPITFAHHLMAYTQMFLRDIARLEDMVTRMDYSPLGNGALAGTTYPLDRSFVAAQLHMAGVTANSLDGVSDRDFALELLGALSITMVHLSRFAEEIILWCSWEFQFIELDDAFSTGSSIMPQKKNPDIAELVRGKAGRVFGNQMALLTVMKGLPLAYNKDMQEDKEAVFDAIDTVHMCLAAFTPMLKTMQVKKENMYAAAAQGFINATDCADYLVKKGLAFRDAYKIIGALVAYCITSNKTLETLSLIEYQKFSSSFAEDVYDAISLLQCVENRSLPGGPAPSSVKTQIETALKEIEDWKNKYA